MYVCMYVYAIYIISSVISYVVTLCEYMYCVLTKCACVYVSVCMGGAVGGTW